MEDYRHYEEETVICSANLSTLEHRTGTEENIYHKAEAVIYSASLSALEHCMLLSFVENSVELDEAARFIIDQVSRGSEAGMSAEQTLRCIKEDLTTLARRCFLNNDVDSPSPDVEAALHRRQEGRCYMSGCDTGLMSTYIISPRIKDDEEIKPGGRLRPLFEAAVSARLAGEIFSYLESSLDEADQLKNLWLMSPYVRPAFRWGHVTVIKLSSSWSVIKRGPGPRSIPGLESNQFHSNPSTPDEVGLPLPEKKLLKAHSAISISLHYLMIEQEIDFGWRSRHEPRKLGIVGKYALRTLFHVIPAFLCLMIYRLIINMVTYWDPHEDPGMLFLPFGLCLKINRRVSHNEANALLLIEKHTSINAPRLINMTMGKEQGYLLMTTVPGIPMEAVFYRMTYEEQHQLAKDLGKWINEYRCIPNNNKEYLLCDTLGGPLIDHRIGSTKPCGPYNTVADFLNHLVAEDIRKQYPFSLLYEKEHRICFTHADLHLSNLMVNNGRLVGIVDWEHAGFRPEYWEYTKSLWPYFARKRFANIFNLAFDKNYDDELKAELELWRRYPTY